MKLFHKLSGFFNKNNDAQKQFFEKKLDSAKNLLVFDKKRYLKEYSDTPEAIKAINDHFDEMLTELSEIELDDDYHRIEFYFGKIVHKDQALFSDLQKLKSY